jgi:hypothetical protein
VGIVSQAYSATPVTVDVEEETDKAVFFLVVENGFGDLVVVGRHGWVQG